MDNDLTLRDAAARATHYLGHEIHIIDKYNHGGEGAYQVTVKDIPYVFKYWSGKQAVDMHLAIAANAHGILQQCGWPLPDIHSWRSDPHFAFVLETQMRGNRVDSVSEALCKQLLTLLAAVPPGVSECKV